MIKVQSETSEASGREQVAIYASRINFIDEDHIKVINENQLECIFKIQPHDEQKVILDDEEEGSLVLKSTVHIDNLATNAKSLDCPHLELDPAFLNNDQTIARLIRKN